MNVPSFLRKPLTITLLFGAMVSIAPAAPYGPEGLLTTWDQPGAGKLTLRVFGDEFYARTETEAGYTVIYDPLDRCYRYAELTPDGRSLRAGSTQAHVPAPTGLPKHLSPAPSIIKEQREAEIRKYAGDRERLWRQKVEAARTHRAAKGEEHSVPAPAETDPAPERPEVFLSGSTGESIVGLTILVQFPDDPDTPAVDPTNFPTTREKIERYGNEVGYTDDGNTGSIRDYFADQSLGALTYTQLVTPIVTLPHPRDYYNYADYPDNTDLSGAAGAGRAMISDAVDVLKATGFDFSAVTLDSGDKVVAVNVLFAGRTSGVWNAGLWPHSSTLLPKINAGTLENPIDLWRYQCTNAPSASPPIGTFIHENGHLLFFFPDIYDSNPANGDSEGVGRHCLMGTGNLIDGGRTPAPLNAYFRDICGWATIVDHTAEQISTVTIPSTGNIAHRILKPGTPTEYFLIENHGAGDKWASSLPDQGIVIWHIDETKDGNPNQHMTALAHYEVSLEQADGLFDLENNVNAGDAQDLFDADDPLFSDLTTPDARWWDGTSSDITINVTSGPGASMEVEFGDTLPPNTIIVISPNGGETLYQGAVTEITWKSNTPGDVRIDLDKGGSPHTVLSASETNDGVYSGTLPAGLPAGADYTVRISSITNPAFTDSSDAPFEIQSLAEALDTTGLVWNTGGDANWFPQSTTSQDGIDAAESGPIDDSESTDLETTIVGPGTLSFWWMVSSENNYDFLRLFLDDVEQGDVLSAISGTTSWEQKSLTIPTGTHTVKWSFTKDSSVSNGADAGWLDGVVFTPSGTPIEIWRFENFGTTTNSGPAANDVDGDLDALDNLAEYAFKRDPTTHDRFPVTQHESAGSIIIIYPRNLAATDLTFTIEESRDLGQTDPWATAAVTEEILGTTDGVQTVQATRSLAPDEDLVFLRLEIGFKP